MAFYIVKRRLIKKIICWCWKKKVWNNKQNPVKWIFKKANRHTEVWISKYSLTYNKVCSKRCFLELLTANSGSQLRKLHTCYKELPNFCIVLERVGEVIPKSWSVKAVKKEIRSRDGRPVSVDDAAKTGCWMLFSCKVLKHFRWRVYWPFTNPTGKVKYWPALSLLKWNKHTSGVDYLWSFIISRQQKVIL